MANLNFEQPPRSIANASLTSRAGGGGGLNSSTLTGHVTPTSGMFSGSSASTSSSANSAVVATNVYPGASGTGGGQNSHQPQQQQLSPMGSRGLFAQRAFTDRRTMPALGLVLYFIRLKMYYIFDIYYLLVTNWRLTAVSDLGRRILFLVNLLLVSNSDFIASK